MSHQEPGMGQNRSGMAMSAKLSKIMQQGNDAIDWSLLPESPEDPDAIIMDYLQEAHPIGSIPLPLPVDGLIHGAHEILKGCCGEALIDRMGERLCFERSSVRLYQALLRKCEADIALPPEIDIDRLEDIGKAKLSNMLLLRHIMLNLEVDPTAVTPSADAMGLTTGGILQVVTDPRTSYAQCLSAMLIAELADHEGWLLLIAILAAFGEHELFGTFQKVLLEGEDHVTAIRSMVRELTLAKAGLNNFAFDD